MQVAARSELRWSERMRCGVGVIPSDIGSRAAIAGQTLRRRHVDPTTPRYVDHLTTEKNSSAHTTRAYEDGLTLFCTFLAEVKGEGADPADVDSRDLRRYSAWLSSRGYAPSTVARRLASLRSFFRF